MKKWKNANDLFCDDFKAVILCEYSYEMKLLKRLIEIAEAGIDMKKPKDTWNHDGICYLFARSIADYAKMAYDNFLLGHFSATNMINRVIIENNICLDILLNYRQEELWKYYLVYSFKKTISLPGKEVSEKQKDSLEKMYIQYEIDSEFLKKRKSPGGKSKPAFIDCPYGWTYKINEQFNFEGLCKLVNKSEYKDFRMMSDYSHGTAIYLKLGESTSMDHIMNMISCIYIGLYRLVTMYCLDYVDPEFDDVTEEIENILYDYIHESERIYTD